MQLFAILSFTHIKLIIFNSSCPLWAFNGFLHISINLECLLSDEWIVVATLVIIEVTLKLTIIDLAGVGRCCYTVHDNFNNCENYITDLYPNICLRPSLWCICTLNLSIARLCLRTDSGTAMKIQTLHFLLIYSWSIKSLNLSVQIPIVQIRKC